jgi:oxygen-independent coproporphyrinogen-3 oxidase
VDAYLDALIREIRETSGLMKDRILDTVYIGGGTPTTLEPDQLDRLLTAIETWFPMDRIQEFTVEAGRPDSITAEKLRTLRRHKITRISVNPQTMKEETLKIIGRRHTVDQTVEAFRLARQEGFDNINMDIILGLPEETPEDVAETIRRIEALDPDSLTVHSLAVKRASRLQQWIEQNGFSALNNTDESMRIAAEGAARMDMVPYYLYRQKNMSGNFENVGYAREGKYGIYNILIMEETQSILALGAGSISKALFENGRIERADNCKDVATYIETIEEMIARKRRLFGL